MQNQDIDEVNLTESFNLGDVSQLPKSNILSSGKGAKYPSDVKSREDSQFKSKAAAT